jgi:hypothetical protein
MTELDSGHRGHLGAACEGRRHSRVVSQTVEGAQFAVGETAQQVDESLD